MPILAIDTASRWTGIAIFDEKNNQILAEKGWIATLRQTVELAPAIEQMLAETGLKSADLTGLSVAIGPGSYTGLRIGLSIARGIALVHDLPIAPVKTHDIVAENCPRYLERLLVAVEAGRKRVLIAPYRWSGEKWAADGEINNPTWPELFESITDEVILVGEIPDDAKAEIEKSHPNIKIGPAEQCTRSAAVLARLGAEKIASGGVPDSNSLVPEYLRQP